MRRVRLSKSVTKARANSAVSTSVSSVNHRCATSKRVAPHNPQHFRIEAQIAIQRLSPSNVMLLNFNQNQLIKNQRNLNDGLF